MRIHADWYYSYVTRSQRTAQLLCRTCKTYQLTFSAYCRSTSLRTAFTFAMALAAYDWLVWKDRAASFLRAHPREVALQLTWGQQLVVPGAREAYAVATYEREAMGRSLGAAPCNLCGCWTHSWCEACKTRPPTAICSTLRRGQTLVSVLHVWSPARLLRGCHRSHSSNFLSSRNWTCEVVFRVQHGQGGAGESDEHGGKCAATCGEWLERQKFRLGPLEKAEVSGTLCVATEPKLSAQNGSTSCTATVRGLAAEGSTLVWLPRAGCALLWTASESELLCFSSFAFHLGLQTAECLCHLIFVSVCVVTNRTRNHDRIAYMWQKKGSFRFWLLSFSI